MQETLPRELLDAALESGYLFCVEQQAAVPVVAGFIAALPAEDALHVQEVSVHPEHGGQGLGRVLLKAVERKAEVQGYQSLTLTTFSDLPFNAPFYRRLGYQDETAPDARLQALLDGEATAGLKNRVAMRKRLKVS